jgi:hypothetical protein
MVGDRHELPLNLSDSRCKAIPSEWRTIIAAASLVKTTRMAGLSTSIGW